MEEDLTLDYAACMVCGKPQTAHVVQLDLFGAPQVRCSDAPPEEDEDLDDGVL